jgi:hypothetical protein
VDSFQPLTSIGSVIVIYATMIGRPCFEMDDEARELMKSKRTYSRTVSSEEAREGYLLVLKNKLQLFPHVGEEIDIIQHGFIVRAKVESYGCTCRGPELPHEHYFIRWKGLKPKDRVEIQEDPEMKGRYRIRIRP